MTWLEFKTIVNEQLAVDNARLGAEAFISRQLRFAVSDVQRLITYYRKGMVSTFSAASVGTSPDGKASIVTLPPGIILRELYYVLATNKKYRRSLREYPFSNRFDLVNGYVDLGENGQWFRYAIDPRDGGRKLWVYPWLIHDWVLEVHWDASLGRSSPEYTDTTDVPFDEPMAEVVILYVKAALAREVDRDLRLADDYRKSYRERVAALYSDTEERLRIKTIGSEATGQPCECAEDEGSEGQQDTCMFTLFKEFETVAEMLAYPSVYWRIARCRNFEENDGITSYWIKTEVTEGLSDVGMNIRQTADGAWVERMYTNP